MTDVNEQDSNTDEAQDANDESAANEQDSKREGFDALPPETQKLIKQLRRQNADFRREADEAKASVQKAADEESKKKGEWETIAKQREDELESLKGQLAERDLRERKTAIAKTAGLPDELADRLKGETDEELEADAKAMAKHLKAQDAPDNDAGKRTAPGLKKPDKSAYADPARWGLQTRR